jgi:hydrogenase maturation protease
VIEPRVVALGQPLAGDDGVGLVVLDALRQVTDLPPCELHFAREATALLGLLDGAERVIVVDALIGVDPGTVLVLERPALQASNARPLSSHGLDALSAIELHAALCATQPPSVVFVGVGVGLLLPTPGAGLTPAVAEAVPLAARHVLELLVGAPDAVLARS